MPRRPGTSVTAVPLELPPVHLARDHLPNVVTARLRSGEWARVARGVYLADGPDAGAAADPGTRAEHRRRVQLAQIVGHHLRTSAPHAYSHASAAALWGLPLWRLDPVVHVRQTSRPTRRGDDRVRRHIGLPPAAHLVERSGLPCSSLAATLADCARTMPPLDALVVLDAGLRLGAERAEIVDLLPRRGRGVVRARELCHLADDGAESPGETATRFVLLREGLPVPETQLRLPTRLGTFWGDLGWQEWRLVLEYDGRGKYLSDPAALWSEKRRHDAIVESGIRVLHVAAEDLSHRGLASRVLAMLPPDIRASSRPRACLQPP